MAKFLGKGKGGNYLVKVYSKTGETYIESFMFLRDAKLFLKTFK